MFILACLIGVAGCDSPKPTFDVRDPDPSIKIPAIKIAVQEKDLQQLRQLVKDLDSDDSAVRFYSIGGLRRLTGETFGYQYYDDASERAPAVMKWQKWVADHDPKSATRTSDSAADSSGSN